MEINIKIKDYSNATLEIDGRVFEINQSANITELHGLGDDGDSTIGGMVANSIFDVISNVMMVLPEASGTYATWDTMSEDDADYVYDRLS